MPLLGFAVLGGALVADLIIVPVLRRYVFPIADPALVALGEAIARRRG